MPDLSPDARRVLEGLLAGKSLNELAEPGSRVRAEVEDHLMESMSAGGGTSTGRRSPTRRRESAEPAPVKMPGGGVAVVFSDGASRGNPGPAAIGVRILDADGVELLARKEAIKVCFVP